MMRLLILVAMLTGLASPARAWWEYGHETVATIAMTSVQPETRRAIHRLLARSDLMETPTCPARTIEQASVWADCIKTLKDRYSYAFNWHYQNIDVCRPFDIKANCPDGNCVARQIERDVRMLKNRELPLRVRVEALLFLVHFMGDLHQPLHAGDRHDRGGNDMKADYGHVPNSNLHSIWDGLLAERAISTPVDGPKGILAEVPVAERPAMKQGTVEDWSRESWQVAHDAYAALLGDACAPVPANRPALDNAKVAALIPVLRRQVARGGLRLARLLDEALG
ncbi:S1/P1 nuclease [Rhizorhabdus sp.]|uniref:S1/P1 nuclease n=1 Tax=Rhizorhabdus sp. TaxID=1968843 RepID=UPI0019A0148D|nr:S1/P1 nuclease [Rhizorhabdus sp.]MBD3762387.1 S1/P1 nuclease [Rhizorhabdus sp.]